MPQAGKHNLIIFSKDGAHSQVVIQSGDEITSYGFYPAFRSVKGVLFTLAHWGIAGEIIYPKIQENIEPLKNLNPALYSMWASSILLAEFCLSSCLMAGTIKEEKMTMHELKGKIADEEILLKELNDAEYAHVMRAIKNAKRYPYHAFVNNCATFAYRIAKAAGVRLPIKSYTPNNLSRAIQATNQKNETPGREDRSKEYLTFSF